MAVLYTVLRSAPCCFHVVVIQHDGVQAFFQGVIKVQPAPLSYSLPSPAILVSLRATMPMLYLASSLTISTVRLWSLSVVSLSRSARTLHDPRAAERIGQALEKGDRKYDYVK